MSREVCVHTWPCSYYLELDKRWVPGKLSLTSRSLKFMADEAQETLVSFPLSGITAIKKEASHFVFSSITVLEKDSHKHWFSSLLPSRNAAFSVIEHFWRELLLSQPEAPLPATKGKELTGLMVCSQKRLEDTARILHHQGEQLDSISRGLDKMESDLDVADRLLTELESPSWWPFSSKLWKTPSETKPKEGASTSSPKALGKEGVVVRIPAVVSQRTASHVKPGSLTVLVSGLEIHDSSSMLMHRMPEAIPVLEVQFSKKMEVLGDALTPGSTRTSSAAERGSSVWHAASGLMDRAAHREPCPGSQEVQPFQVQARQPFISEGDAQELRQILRKLKGLALDTEAELERQDEALDDITAAVDRTTLTIDKHNRRAKKLT
ncbi:synaptosomal-associated protein 47 isoform X2 [Hyaena hyaena]|uniref:synaptosomal-associated protein 47 isoform X2 n=1 Tax=Hyaena hyaena TaxID=95912 RepID=UPI001920E92E|nr:synaptosomal-associated protein 47 isoform X2 [Hyaena hyaena]